MKRFACIVVAALLLTSVGLTIRGDTEGSATASIFCVVDPDVAVAVNTPIVDAGTVQRGKFSAVINFRVDANIQSVYLYAEATPLYKGDDPASEVAPINLDLSAGVTIQPTNANPMAGASNVASYVEDTMIGNYPAKKTEMICYESGQNNHFSQDVFVTVVWDQDQLEKPTGEYSGKVKLSCLLMP